MPADTELLNGNKASLYGCLFLHDGITRFKLQNDQSVISECLNVVQLLLTFYVLHGYKVEQPFWKKVVNTISIYARTHSAFLYVLFIQGFVSKVLLL